MVEVEEQGAIVMNPITFVLQFLASYGWLLVGVSASVLYALHKLRPKIHKWKEAREDALYHKDPDATLARLQAVQDARERQQRAMEEASLRALELQKEREEARREAAASRRERLGEQGGEGGQRLGGDGFLPLSAGASSSSSYRAPKRSACSRGGCGR